MTLGEQLRQLLEHIYGLWPLRIVKDWEQGVRIRHGNATALLTSTNGLWGTGLHLFWPLLGEILVDDTNIEVTETQYQTCITEDGKDVTFSMAIKYRVRDLKALYLKIHDAEHTLEEEIRSAAGHVVSHESFDSLRQDFGPKVEVQARKQMHGWGVDLLSVSRVNFTSAQPFRLIQDSTE